MAELFSTFGIDWRLLLIQAVNFGVLLLALWYFLYTPVMNMIENRRQKIAEGVKNAEEAKKQLAEAGQEREEIVGKAAQEAEGIVASARERAEEKGTELVGNAKARADSMLADAAARAEEIARKTHAESEKGIAKAAVLMAEKVLREKVGGK